MGSSHGGGVASPPIKVPTIPGKGMWSRRLQAPALFLSIDGQDSTDLLRLLIKFHYKHDLKKSAETTFEFWNDTDMIQDTRFFANAIWSFRFGYLGDLSDTMVGYLREIEPTYGEKKTVTVKVYDAALNMSVSSNSTNWGCIQSSDIAQALAAQYGFQTDIAPSNDTPKKAWIQPGDVNDIQFLRDLAAAIDFELVISGSPPTLVYRPKPYGAAPEGTLVYFSDNTEYAWVKSFKPKIKGLGPVKSGTASTSAGASTTAGEQGAPGLSPYQLQVAADSGGASVVPATQNGITKPVPDGTNTTRAAHATRQTLLDHVNEAHSEHPMTPSLILGRTWMWDGDIDKQLRGKWYMSAVEHEITGNSSSTKGTWKRNATNNDANKPVPNPNSKVEDGGVDISGETGGKTVQ